MVQAIVLAGNAETHPQASFIVGIIAVVAVVGAIAWLAHKFK